MRDRALRRKVEAAMMAAICCVLTMVVKVPSPMDGYVNLGDCAVLLSGWMLGPVYGAAAGGIGSMMADVLGGYGYYAPATLVIKGAMAALAGVLNGSIGRRPFLGRVLGGAAAEGVMVLGYFLFAAVILGNGLGAAASIPGNLVQGIFGLLAGLALCQALRRGGVHLGCL